MSNKPKHGYKNFGEIKRGEEWKKQPVTLTETKKFYFEDILRVCRSLPNRLSVYEYHPDSYALEVLASLSKGKKNTSRRKTNR
jgi:zinc protease